MTNGNKDILDAAGPRLLRIILRDASAGTTVILRTAALRALDAVLSFHLDSSVSAELLREEGLIACFLNTFATVDNNMSVTQMSASGSYALGSGASTRDLQYPDVINLMALFFKRTEGNRNTTYSYLRRGIVILVTCAEGNPVR